VRVVALLARGIDGAGGEYGGEGKDVVGLGVITL
jgi:hypothetical protein